MKNLELIRLEEDFKCGTFGVLKIDKVVFCVTLEPPDLLNAQNRSCIPAKQYECEKWDSPTHGLTYRLVSVPGRSNILFHPGNRIVDTDGCILLGQYFGKLRGDRAILNSGLTFREFLAKMIPDPIVHLTITEHY